MKSSTPKPSAAQTPVFPQTLHRLRPAPEAAPAKAKQHDNGKSRDTREDRGTREMKTSHNVQTMPHGH